MLPTPTLCACLFLLVRAHGKDLMSSNGVGCGLGLDYQATLVCFLQHTEIWLDNAGISWPGMSNTRDTSRDSAVFLRWKCLLELGLILHTVCQQRPGVRGDDWF